MVSDSSGYAETSARPVPARPPRNRSYSLRETQPSFDSARKEEPRAGCPASLQLASARALRPPPSPTFFTLVGPVERRTHARPPPQRARPSSHLVGALKGRPPNPCPARTAPSSRVALPRVYSLSGPRRPRPGNPSLCTFFVNTITNAQNNSQMLINARGCPQLRGSAGVALFGGLQRTV